LLWRENVVVIYLPHHHHHHYHHLQLPGDGTLAGDAGFDPLGLSELNTLGLDLYWFREAEIKHGRIAMLAGEKDCLMYV